MMKCMAFALLVAMAAGEKRLIETAPGVRQWMTEEELLKIIGRPGKKNNIMDVTDYVNTTRKVAAPRAMNYPTVGVHHHYVNSITDTFNINDVISTIDSLAAYHTRYYTSDTGRDAANWLAQQYQAAIPAGRAGVHVSTFFHSWEQPSVIVTIDGTNPALRNETIILGGHIDSINGATGRAPGADDDGSGSATVFQIFKALMQNQFRPEKTVEFHGYAAEEVGLRGSADVARAYAAEGRGVAAMLQLDMTGYTAMATPAIGLIDDQTDPTLNSWIAEAISFYLTIGYQHSRCGYGCSDHASWTANGYAAAFPFETPFGQHNPSIHTANDVVANLNTDHMMEFVKLGTAFVCDMACPSGTEGCT